MPSRLAPSRSAPSPEISRILLSSLSNLSSIVDCSAACPAASALLARHWPTPRRPAPLSPADLQTLQDRITEPDPGWDATSLSDVDGSDSGDIGVGDQTTLADLVALANSDSTFAQAFTVPVLSDVSGSDPPDDHRRHPATLTGTTDGTTLADLLGPS